MPHHDTAASLASTPHNVDMNELLDRRRRNRIAAQNSRKRKEGQLRSLESQIEELRKEVERWKTMTEVLEGMMKGTPLVGPGSAMVGRLT